MKMHRKRCLAVVLLLTLTVTQCMNPTVVQAANRKPAAVKTIKLQQKSLQLDKGKQAIVKVTIAPKAAKNAKLVWKSSKPKVAAVTQKGKIKAKSAGTTKITVTVKGTKKRASCTVKVLIPIKKMSVSPRKIEVKETEKKRLKVNISPKNASYRTLIYQSEDTSIASVSKNGVIEGRKAGKTKIVILVKNTKKKVTVPVTVIAKEEKPSQADTTSTAPSEISKPSADLSQPMPSEVETPSQPVPSSVTAPSQSMPSEVETPSQSVPSSVTAPSQPMPSEVETPSQSVPSSVINPSQSTPSEVETPSQSVSSSVTAPSQPTPSEVETPSQPTPSEVETPSQSVPSSVTAPSQPMPSEVEIPSQPTPSTSQSIAVSGVSIMNSYRTIEMGDTLQLKAQVSPLNATQTEVSWSSSNDAIAKIDATTGVITPIAEGTAKITVTTKDGKKQADCEIKVVKELLPTMAYYSTDVGSTWQESDIKIGIQDVNGVQTVTVVGKRSSFEEYVKNYTYFKIGSTLDAKFESKLERQEDGSYRIITQPGTTREKSYPIYYEKDLSLCLLESFTDEENMITSKIQSSALDEQGIPYTVIIVEGSKEELTNPVLTVLGQKTTCTYMKAESSKGIGVLTVKTLLQKMEYWIKYKKAEQYSIYPTSIQTYRYDEWKDMDTEVRYDSVTKRMIVIGKYANYGTMISSNTYEEEKKPKYVCKYNQNVVYTTSEEEGKYYLTIDSGTGIPEKVEIYYECDLKKAEIIDFTDGDNFIVKCWDAGVDCDAQNRKYNRLVIEGENDTLTNPTAKLKGCETVGCEYKAVENDIRGCGTLTFRTSLQEKTYWIQYKKTTEKISLLPTSAYVVYSDGKKYKKEANFVATEIEGQEALGIKATSETFDKWWKDYRYDEDTKINELIFTNENIPALKYEFVSNSTERYLIVTKGKETKKIPIIYERELRDWDLTFTDGENLFESVMIDDGKVTVKGLNDTLTEPKLADADGKFQSTYQAGAAGSDYAGILTISSKLQKKEYQVFYKKVEVSILPTNACYEEYNDKRFIYFYNIKVWKDGETDKVAIVGDKKTFSDYLKYENFGFENTINSILKYEVTGDEKDGYSLHIKRGTQEEKVYPIYYEQKLFLSGQSSEKMDKETTMHVSDGTNYIVSWYTERRKGADKNEYIVLVVEGEQDALSNQAVVTVDQRDVTSTCETVTNSKKGGQVLTVRTKLQEEELWIRYIKTRETISYLPQYVEYWDRGEDPKYDEAKTLDISFGMVKNKDGSQSVGIIGKENTLEEILNHEVIQMSAPMNLWLQYEIDQTAKTLTIKKGENDSQTYPIVYEQSLDPTAISAVTEEENYILDTGCAQECVWNKEKGKYEDQYTLNITGENTSLSNPKAVFPNMETTSVYTPLENSEQGCGILKVSTATNMQTISYYVKYSRKIHTLTLKKVKWQDGTETEVPSGYRNEYKLTTNKDLNTATLVFDVPDFTQYSIEKQTDAKNTYNVTISYKGEQQQILINVSND